MSLSLDDLGKRYAQLRSDLIAARVVSLVKGLRRYFREPITVEKATGTLQRDLETREDRFLDLVQSQVYSRPGNPYLKLLNMAGCVYSDLRAAVRSRGLEKTLKKLADEGVYLTLEEFKGKTDVVRGAVSFRVGVEDFRLKRNDRDSMSSAKVAGRRDHHSVIPFRWIVWQRRAYQPVSCFAPMSYPIVLMPSTTRFSRPREGYGPYCFRKVRHAARSLVCSSSSDEQLGGSNISRCSDICDRAGD